MKTEAFPVAPQASENATEGVACVQGWPRNVLGAVSFSSLKAQDRLE